MQFINPPGSSSLAPGTTPISGGTDKTVLFDDNGVVGEDADFKWNKTTNVLTVGNSIDYVNGDGIGTLKLNGTQLAGFSNGAFNFNTTQVGFAPSFTNDLALARIGAGQLELNAGAVGSYAGSALVLGLQTVAQLPAPSAANAGARATVLDATTTLVLGLGGTVVGGGGNKTPVWCDGAAWKIG